MHSRAQDAERITRASRDLLSGIGRLGRTLYRLGEFGVPHSHVNVLTALESGPHRVGDLTLPTGLTQPRVTVLLQELEERGLVERRRCTDDRRATHARLTSQGRELLRQARRRIAAALLDALGPDAEAAEPAVAAARETVLTLLNALESEAP
ncbi:MarR family winged helix-turn-helix transcriptional regulator [Streptomyces sp. NPDC090108]|uniref:MarR family winged helix-turn-helix transcriptional regulator n=1 Tax=Streptomyces sp. NPDC090108 TaxID=3365947 RepID=UPI0038149109